MALIYGVGGWSVECDYGISWPNALFNLNSGRYYTKSIYILKKASEYDQDIPQSHTIDQPTTP